MNVWLDAKKEDEEADRQLQEEEEEEEERSEVLFSPPIGILTVKDSSRPCC